MHSPELSTQPADQSTRLTRAISDLTGWLGSFPAILASCLVVAVWFVGGAFVGLGNNTYQLIINTGTTIVTFLMVFIIQNTQNRDGAAVQAKLDAQSEVLRRIAERLDIADDEDLLTMLVGVEDAPAHVISKDQDQVRAAAIRTGRHGAARDSQEPA
ncbi:low affinity iron permease family protein [Cumulibacter manganitolerans]|uniref:low affinity iron permease family protein n=1 Tax=Cumulibacter manganitolerans TaxID=1884992 RepID=UPI001297B807|nr:low affinity iron permease family protein [Cumulibacter manganitolerans]